MERSFPSFGWGFEGNVEISARKLSKQELVSG